MVLMRKVSRKVQRCCGIAECTSAGSPPDPNKLLRSCRQEERKIGFLCIPLAPMFINWAVEGALSRYGQGDQPAMHLYLKPQAMRVLVCRLLLSALPARIILLRAGSSRNKSAAYAELLPLADVAYGYGTFAGRVLSSWGTKLGLRQASPWLRLRTRPCLECDGITLEQISALIEQRVLQLGLADIQVGGFRPPPSLFLRFVARLSDAERVEKACNCGR